MNFKTHLADSWFFFRFFFQFPFHSLLWLNAIWVISKFFYVWLWKLNHFVINPISYSMNPGQPEINNFLSGDGMNERNIRRFGSLFIFDLLTRNSSFGDDNDSFFVVEKYELSITKKHMARLIRNQSAICKPWLLSIWWNSINCAPIALWSVTAGRILINSTRYSQIQCKEIQKHTQLSIALFQTLYDVRFRISICYLIKDSLINSTAISNWNQTKINLDKFVNDWHLTFNKIGWTVNSEHLQW